MKKISAILSLAALCSCLYGADPQAKTFRQVYDLDPAKVDAYTKTLTADLAKATAWKDAPAFYYVVPPLSDVPRLPDTFPSDGIPCGTVQIVASQGEYEPGSIVIAPMKNVDSFTLKASELRGPGGAKIPVSNIDIKMIKVWYQAGSGWYGYFADALGRTLVPEMLLNDESMVRVVPGTKDNYVRYNNQDGSVSYHWISANFMVTGYSYSNQANHGLIGDAPTLQPVVLNKNEFKQYFITVRVPENVPGGFYSGDLDLVADGKVIGKAPITVKVLPFKLPAPKTNYDQNKGFYLSMYGTATRNPVVLKNLAAHNCTNPMGFPSINPFDAEQTRKNIQLAKDCGISTSPLLSGATRVGVTVWQKEEDLKGAELLKIERLRSALKMTRE
ncbi:MAG: hypothetical protein J6Q65_02430, partial [Lentisphaeria bacterium]|nr:hypothetical protein [Lentisphaeria bacterium]